MYIWSDRRMRERASESLGSRLAADDARPQGCVLVGGRSRYDEDWPLLVDPDAGKVTVLETSIRHGLDARPLARTSGAVFRSKYNRLYRIGLPSFHSEITLPGGVPEGYCVSHGDKFLVFGLKCWEVDPAAESGKHVRPLASGVPWPFEDRSPLGWRLAREENLTQEDVKAYRLEFIGRSSHFGLLAVRRKPDRVSESISRPVQDEVFRIVFDE